MPTMIIDYATQRRDDAKKAVTTAKQRLTTAQTGIAARSKEVEDSTSVLTELEKKAAEIRQKLSTIPTPADGSALLDTLEQTIIQIRYEQSKILQAQTGLLAAQSDAARAQAELSAATSRLTTREADLKQAALSGKQRAAWANALGTVPLSKINTDADKALKNKPFKDAQKRIAADLPTSLLTRAEERRADESARLARRSAETQAAEAALLAEVKKGGAAGQASEQWAAFLRLEAAARDFINTAKGRFDQAQAMLAEVGDTTRSPLTDEQVERINDASLTVARDAAAGIEKALDAKLKDLEDKQAVLAEEILKAKAANQVPEDEQAVKDATKDVEDAQLAFDAANNAWRAEEQARDAAQEAVGAQQAILAQAIQKAIVAKQNPDIDPGVIQAKSDLAAAQQDLKDAIDAYKLSNRGILHAWEAAMPDTAWQLVDDYEEAAEILQALRDSDPAKLKTELEQAEADYVAAQLIADASASVLEQLAAEQDVRAAHEQSVRQAEAARLFSALRGDN